MSVPGFTGHVIAGSGLYLSSKKIFLVQPIYLYKQMYFQGFDHHVHTNKPTRSHALLKHKRINTQTVTHRYIQIYAYENKPAHIS